MNELKNLLKKIESILEDEVNLNIDEDQRIELDAIYACANISSYYQEENPIFFMHLAKNLIISHLPYENLKLEKLQYILDSFFLEIKENLNEIYYVIKEKIDEYNTNT